MEKTIRAFGRSELAQQYFPQISPMSAWRKFREWLVLNPSLTPAEVQLIYTELGEP